MIRVLGIDASPTNTGLAMLPGLGPKVIEPGAKIDPHIVTSIHIEDEGWSRVQLIAKNFVRIIEAWQPDVAYIEAYAPNRGGSMTTIIKQVEVGTIFRQVLTYREIPWRTIHPSSLKKWVTGKGTSKKPEMMKKAKEKWGFAHKSHDVVDAYCLAKMGQFLLEADAEKYPPGIEFGYGTLDDLIL